MAYRLPYRLKITVISFHETYYFLYAAKFIIKNLKKRGALLKKRKALNFQVQTDFFMILLTQCNKQMPLPNPWHLTYQLLMSVAESWPSSDSWEKLGATNEDLLLWSSTLKSLHYRRDGVNFSERKNGVILTKKDESLAELKFDNLTFNIEILS